MSLTLRTATVLAASLALAACATSPGGTDAPPVDLAGAEVTTRTLPNGDIVEEHRVGPLLRMVKITPVRGPTYHLYDRDGDGLLDREGRKGLPQTYWTLFSW